MVREREVVVGLQEGLHARPAARLAQLAKGFQSAIEIRKGDAAANAKSTVKVMLMTVREGERIRIRAEGDDAEAALGELATYLGGAVGDAGPRRAEPAPAAAACEPDPLAGSPRDGEAGLRISGVSGNDGVALGPAFVYLPDRSTPVRRALAAGAIAAELQRFRDAVRTVGTALEAAPGAGGSETVQARVFAAIRELAQDVELLGPIEQRIAQGQDAVSSSLEVGAALAERLAGVDDAYFRLRADDVRGVALRIADVLRGEDATGPEALPLREPSIVVADELSALDFARLPASMILGLLTSAGGATSHIAILARALGLPAVVGADMPLAALRCARRVALDGGRGIAILDPDAATEQEFVRRLADAAESRRQLAGFAQIAPRTRDGVAIEVAANIGSATEAEAALQSGAMGVGLFRTEFMVMQGAALPTEQEQLDLYARVLEAFAPRPVLIRTLDVGGDKPLPGVACAPEANPFLGWRGIRMCLDEPGLFDPQLRALLRAATRGRLRVMFPMISDISEVVAARQRLQDCRAALHREGVRTGPIELGVMIETPAAALCARMLAEQVDFFSIGTNDLTQYTMAADRTNARLGRLNRADHPAVLRLVELACEAARQAGIWVGICGEAASDPALIPRWLSWGVTELSVSPR